jgi:hypothetical protein
MRIDPPAGDSPWIGGGAQPDVHLPHDRPRLAALAELERGKPHPTIEAGQPDQPAVVRVDIPAAHLIRGQRRQPEKPCPHPSIELAKPSVWLGHRFRLGDGAWLGHRVHVGDGAWLGVWLAV